MLKHVREAKPVFTTIIPNLAMPDRTHTNPGLLRWKDHWIFLSCAGLTFDSYVLVSRLNDNFEVTHSEVLKTSCDRPPLTTGAEDPRIFVVKDKIYISYNYSWSARNNWAARGGRVVLCEFDPDRLKVLSENVLDHPSLYVYEKNWMFFDYRGFISFIHRVDKDAKMGLVFKNRVRFNTHSTVGLHWDHGLPRGGTPAILVGDEYYAWFHSHVEEPPMRHYVAGMFTFRMNPFRICRVSRIMLYPPEQNESRSLWPYRVVFPCGLALHEGLWYTSYGVNDYQCRISAFTVDEVERQLQPV